MTLRTLMSEATTLAGNRSDIAISTVSLQVNLAQLEVAAMAPHGALESTATLAVLADSNTTTLPADFAEPIAVSRVSSYDNFAYRLLTEVGIGQIDNASEGTTAGTPNRYAVYNGALFFYPTPSSADSLILRYRRVPADMTELTDLPSLHTFYHPAILMKTVEYLCDHVLDREGAALARNRFISMMQSIPATAELRVRSERTLGG